MTTPIPVSLAGDWTWGLTSHSVVAPWDFVDLPASMDWPPGKCGTHKFASSVLHKGQQIVLEGHDQGPCLLHGPSLNPFTVLKSSRKTLYSVSAVKAQGTPVGCFYKIGLAPGILCGDMAMAMGLNSDSSIHSVFVGMTPGDNHRGLIRHYYMALTDIATIAVSGATSALPGAGAVSRSDLVKDLALDVLGFDDKKAMVGTITSLGESVALSALSGWNEPIVVQTGVGGPALGYTRTYTYDPRTGDFGRKDALTTVGGGKAEVSTGSKPGLVGTIPWGDTTKFGDPL